MIYLGFDTSNYTTSVAAVGTEDGAEENSTVNFSEKKMVEVPEGERGIRQNEAVFSHIKALPDLYESLSLEIDMGKVRAVGVSVRPRNVEDSYMPVFMAGYGYARVVADTLNVPLYEFSHQEGHIMAGIASGNHNELLDGEFLAVHVSGGTTEILKCKFNGNGFDTEIIGGTSDISAGQFIDRVGVAMGMEFPAGKELSQLSKEAERPVRFPLSVDGMSMSYSGVETKATRMIEDGEAENSAIALGVIYNVRDTLVLTINEAVKQTGLNRVLVVGGVASNDVVRSGLAMKIEGTAYFAKPEFSMDNALGAAALASVIK